MKTREFKTHNKAVKSELNKLLKARGETSKLIRTKVGKRQWVRYTENIIHMIFLLLGLITVGCVLLITVYLIVSGIPALAKILSYA